MNRRVTVQPGIILPKYTAAQLIEAMHTLQTLEELEKFWGVIRDNHHLAKDYKKQIKVHYVRRKALLEAATDAPKE